MCSDVKVKRPYRIKALGISVYSIEELAYYIYGYLYFIDADFFDERLMSFIGEELGMARLEQKLRKWIADGSDMAQLLYMIEQESGYYTEAELAPFRARLDEMRREMPSERMKGKADLMLKNGWVRGAIKVYEEITAMSPDKGMTPEFMGTVYYDLGAAYAGLFEYEKALACFEKAWDISRGDDMLKCMYMLCLMDTGLDMPEAVRENASMEQQYKWSQEFDALRTEVILAGGTQDIEELWQKDSVRKKAGISSLISGWKQEYREMIRS